MSARIDIGGCWGDRSADFPLRTLAISAGRLGTLGAQRLAGQEWRRGRARLKLFCGPRMRLHKERAKTEYFLGCLRSIRPGSLPSKDFF
jgi:hypothetical protein